MGSKGGSGGTQNFGQMPTGGSTPNPQANASYQQATAPAGSSTPATPATNVMGQAPAVAPTNPSAMTAMQSAFAGSNGDIYNPANKSNYQFTGNVPYQTPLNVSGMMPYQSNNPYTGQAQAIDPSAYAALNARLYNGQPSTWGAFNQNYMNNSYSPLPYGIQPRGTYMPPPPNINQRSEPGAETKMNPYGVGFGRPNPQVDLLRQALGMTNPYTNQNNSQRSQDYSNLRNDLSSLLSKYAGLFS